MTHEWKIGDWCRLQGRRYLVFRVDRQVFAIPFEGGGNEIMFCRDDSEVEYLDGCDSWDWQPPKPIEPPQGYRLLTENDTILLTDKWWHFHKYWDDLSEASDSLGRKWNPVENTPMCRKIEPKVRPMTRSEFLAAWKQRGFCPLIDEDNDVQAVLYVIDETECDFACVNLHDSGWMEMNDLVSFKFASDETYLTVEE